jgi:fatty-acyl-CoA synthase
LGTISVLRYELSLLDYDKTKEYRARQGFPQVGIELRLVDEKGKVLPWDGKSTGEIQGKIILFINYILTLIVRGPFIAKSYFKSADKSSFTADGWFKTGDVATVDTEGYMRIVDRTKDLIKSGGEWISSVELEGTIMSFPKVLECACFAIASDKVNRQVKSSNTL